MSERGSFHIPMAIVLAIFSTAATGLIVLMVEWKANVALQLRIYRCVGNEARFVHASLTEVEALNRRIRQVRAALVVATVRPEVRVALQASLKALVALQEAERLQWTGRSARWMIGRGCAEVRGWPSPYPAFPWRRDPPDAIGDRPLRFLNPAGSGFRLWLRKKSRAAAARIHRSEKQNEKWNADWVAPGPGLD